MKNKIPSAFPDGLHKRKDRYAMSAIFDTLKNALARLLR